MDISIYLSSSEQILTDLIVLYLCLRNTQTVYDEQNGSSLRFNTLAKCVSRGTYKSVTPLAESVLNTPIKENNSAWVLYFLIQLHIVLWRLISIKLI